MAIWHVVNNAGHGGTNAGTSYANAWLGWVNIVWASLSPGDTLKVYGTWALTSNLTVGAHGAAAGGEGTAKVTLDFSEATIGNQTNAVFIQSERANTAFVGGQWNAYSSSILFLLGATRVDVLDATFTGVTTNGTNSILGLSVGNGRTYTDLRIEGNTFTGVAGRGAVAWYHTVVGATTTMTRVSVLNNTFAGIHTHRSVLTFWMELAIAGVGCTMQDITISGNTFDTYSGWACKLSLEYTAFGTSNGLVVENNTFRNGALSLDGSYTSGGCLSLNGFGQSSTAGFGRNRIRGNYAYNIVGDAGFANTFFSVFDIYENETDTTIQNNVDGNGVLLDHGCDGCKVWNNTFRNAIGDLTKGNSGCAIMVLDSINCEIWNNVGIDCNVGIFFGDKTHATTGNVDYQSANVWNNTFIGCTLGGVWMNTAADKALCVAKNNAFSGVGEKVHLNGGAAWTGESYNAFDSGMGGTTNHTLAASSAVVALDVSIDGTPSLDSALVGAGVHLGYSTDRNGVQRFNPPTIGAIEPPRNRGAASAREPRV